MAALYIYLHFTRKTISSAYHYLCNRIINMNLSIFRILFWKKHFLCNLLAFFVSNIVRSNFSSTTFGHPRFSCKRRLKIIARFNISWTSETLVKVLNYFNEWPYFRRKKQVFFKLKIFSLKKITFFTFSESLSKIKVI